MRKKRFGHAFSDEVAKVSSKSTGRTHNVEEASFRESLIEDISSERAVLSPWRRIALLSTFLLIFFGLFLRLFHLQITQGSDWRALADSNRIKVKVIHAPRGVIYDRNGKVLAQNDPAFRLIESSASGQVTSELISRDEALKMEVDNDPRYQNLEIDSIRDYPLDEITAPILGYMGEINQAELNSPNFSNYKLGDQVGRGGVEETYESTLKGQDGGEVIEVDSQGNAISTLYRIDPIPGQNLYLTIDSDLQRWVYQQLVSGVQKVGSCCGAAIVSDPKSGQILAMASYPSYDPKNIAAALSDPNSPFLNRAISGTYPPGSTFKIASALAGLSSGKINPDDIVNDNGITYLGPYTFTNWYYTQYGKVEGPVNLIKAIQRSNDTYFYHLGETVGEQILGDTAKKLGLGKALGIDLPGEANGLIPDDAWKEKNTGQPWYPGDTLHMAIGQGYVLATPLQINNLVSVVAADGKQYPPHLALKVTSPTGKLVKQFDFSNYSTSPFKQSDIALVRQGLDEVPKSGGTAWPFFTFTIPTAGKTGTAQYGDPKDRTHAWYTSYAPADNPQIAVTVLIESAGEGSNDAAPVAKAIYQWYFSKDKNHLTNFDTLPIPIATASAKTLGE